MDPLTGDSAIKLFGQTIAVPFIPLPLPSEVGEDTTFNGSPLLTSCSQASALTSYTAGSDKRRPTLSCTDAATGQLEYVKSRNRSLKHESAALVKGTPSKKEVDVVDVSVAKEKALRKPDKVVACPRCHSFETKFCYYNNYNINQPRHFCKNCQRYWTAGGTLRNVPIGAGRRKNKHGIMMLHRQTLHEDIVVRPDMQDPAQQRSAHSPACQILESCTATSLPKELDFSIQSDTSNVISRSFSCGCHTSDDRNASGDVQDDVGEAQRCCRAYPLETDFRARATKGVNSFRKGASRCGLDHSQGSDFRLGWTKSSDMISHLRPKLAGCPSACSSTCSWTGAERGFWAGALWSSAPCTTPGWACSWGVHHQPPLVQIKKCKTMKGVNFQSELSTCSTLLYANHPLVDAIESGGADPVSKPGETESSAIPAQCSLWTSTGIGSRCDIVAGETSRARNKVPDPGSELLSSRHVNPAAMRRSMAFQETL